MLSRALLGAAALVIIGHAAEAQSLASRVAAVSDGKVRMTFASRDGICGFANGISTRRDDRSTWSKDRSPDVEYDGDCSEGPARVVIQMRDGRPVEVKGYVGGRWRNAPGVTDLGSVGVREATTFLFEVAGGGTNKVSSSAIFAATLADSMDLGSTLSAFARNEAHPHQAREHAIFWLGQNSRGESTGHLVRLYSQLTSRELKDKVVFSLSQRRDSAAFDKLMDIATNDPDRDMRRKAMFWLGQSRDPRVAQMLSDIINR